MLIPKKGYWRYGENSTAFLECPSDTACEGDQNNAPHASYKYSLS